MEDGAAVRGSGRSESRNPDPFFWDLRVSRAGHNYWVLRGIVDRIRRRRNDWTALRAWTEQQIARYVAVADPKWARAVQASFDLTVKHKLLDALDGATR